MSAVAVGGHPANLHVTVASRVTNAPRLSERVEQKFFVLPQREGLAFALLRRTCRADCDYPVGQVNSLYFDTPDLDQHQRSDSGEYVKDKVRIRWYGEEHDPHHADREKQGDGRVERGACGPVATSGSGLVRVWVELKSRRGFASTKQRLVLEVAVSSLAHRVLSRGIVPPSALAKTMASFGFFTYAPLRPVVAISYWRHRFVEPETGFRISIDSHIRSSMVMPGIGRGERGLELPGAVVEIKGPRFQVPPSLREIAKIGSSWTRYSKYSSSLEGHESVHGSVSRLWPNGMMHREPGVLGQVRNDRAPKRRQTQRAVPRFVEDYEIE